jgi:outer membrane protein TolC
MSQSRFAAAALALSTLGAVPLVPAADLAFDRALALSAEQAPQLSARRHSVRAAEEMATAAGQLPDPRLQFGIDNVPAEGPDRWSTTRDPMTMKRIALMQDFPGPGKLAARTERAQGMVGREQAAFDVEAATVRRDVATAWLDRWLSEQTLAVLRELASEAEAQVQVLTRGVAGGRVQAPDVIEARTGVLMIRDRITDGERDVTKSVALLERFIGSAARLPLVSPPDVSRMTTLTADPSAIPDARALAERRPELRLAAREVDVARADATLAALARRPDWNVELSYGIRRPNFDNMIGLMVSIDLPIFPGSRQNREEAAKFARVDELRAQREALLRIHEAELASLLAEWKAANEKLDRYVRDILPLIRDRLWSTTAAYSAERAEIGMVLQARTAFADALVQQLMLEKERARLWAQITFVVLPGEAPGEAP